ncbi:hypothetical protein [Sphingomonas sp. CFBP 8760]|uniref:hypothetical protein n=1 Tax=Sphingomonas sp. CFBP 8760 TaxID=2775282 RepID=UPI001A92B3CE|nr:hypothetical protein [Sphingomonas sp. CFBP 8760]
MAEILVRMRQPIYFDRSGYVGLRKPGIPHGAVMRNSIPNRRIEFGEESVMTPWEAQVREIEAVPAGSRARVLYVKWAIRGLLTVAVTVASSPVLTNCFHDKCKKA